MEVAVQEYHRSLLGIDLAVSQDQDSGTHHTSDNNQKAMQGACKARQRRPAGCTANAGALKPRYAVHVLKLVSSCKLLLA